MKHLPADAGKVLLPLARQAIGHALGIINMPESDQPSWLRQQGASFVTLTKANQQCARIGTLEARNALAEDVRANAVNAAFNYPGCTPLQPEEFDTIAIEVAVLSGPEPIIAENECEAVASLRAGTDGVSFRFGCHSSIFLPEAWTHHPTSADFLAHLKYRAGLPPDFWDAKIDLRRYTVISWRESDHG